MGNWCCCRRTQGVRVECMHQGEPPEGWGSWGMCPPNLLQPLAEGWALRRANSLALLAHGIASLQTELHQVGAPEVWARHISIYDTCQSPEQAHRKGKSRRQIMNQAWGIWAGITCRIPGEDSQWAGANMGAELRREVWLWSAFGS